MTWAQQAGGSSSDWGSSISALADGSSLITGYFYGTASFGSTTLTSAGANDVFIAKLNADGSYAWAQKAGGSGYDYGYSISALADGSSLITGNFSGTASFGSTTLTSAGSYDVFIAKLNADGSYAWAQQAGGSDDDDNGHSISALADGSSLITGNFSGTASFGSTTLTSAGDSDVFIAKLNADGSYAWAQQAGGSGYDRGYSISALADGSSLITGYFYGTASFGSTTLTSAGANDVFIAKLNADGSYAWAQQAGGSGYDRGYSISALADGSSLITGEFNAHEESGTASFGSTTLTSAGYSDVFIAKLNADGSYAWAQQAGGSSNDSGYSISALADGSSLITGYFADDTASFGSSRLTSAGSDDVFIAKLNADGSYAWAQQAGGSDDDDNGHSISALADGSSLITGDFEGTASFGSTALTSAGDSDVFIVKLNADGSWDSTNTSSATNSNDTLTGTDSNDTLTGTDSNDTLTGYDSGEIISGLYGDDIIDAGAGDDVLYGNQGNDKIIAGTGEDKLYGGKGNDTLYGNQGEDKLCGNIEDDFLYGGQGNDTLYGNQGADRLYGNKGVDVLYGGKDNDYLDGGEGDDILYGNIGGDCFYLSAGEDKVMDFNSAEGDWILIPDSTCSLVQQGDDLLLNSESGNLLIANHSIENFNGNIVGA